MKTIIFLIFSIIIILFSLFKILPDLYWFESFNYSYFFIQTIGYKIVIFLSSFSTTYFILFLNELTLNGILKKAEFINRQEETTNSFLYKLKLIIGTFFGQFQSSTKKISKPIKHFVYIFFSLLASLVITNQWDQILLFFNAQPFSLTDPVFNHNISFYMFKYPVLLGLISFLKFMLFVLIVFSLWQYLRRGYFSLLISSTFYGMRLHVFSLISIFFILNACSAYLLRFQLLFKSNNIFFGAGYTDLTITLKALNSFPFIWGLLTLMAIAFIFKPSFKLFLTGIILMVLPNILFLKFIPSIVQNYIVTPNEFNKEKPYIKHNINYTQHAYKLNNINDVDINYQKTIQHVNSNKFNDILNNIRLWNPGPLKSTLKQLQEIRLYYEFKNVDIDRYIINGRPQQVMLSAREIDISQITEQAQTWINKHLMFTHGYGLCLTPVNQFNSEGLPELYIKDIPPVSHTNITISRPEIYFGEATNHYVLANTKQKEFDYPKDNENKYTHYSGKGGILLDSFFKRLLYAIKLKDIKLLISLNIHKKSRLMYDRNISTIPNKMIPFIVFDRDPYLVINDDGKLIWLVDGYTSSKHFPYSTPYGRRINYIRNSVLATIDAYSGETHYYIKDKNDPIIMAYFKIYPTLFKSLNHLPEPLKQHIRYPKDLFKITAKIYNTYHMNDPQVFYNKEDVWTFPTETYDTDSGITLEPYYMYLQNPITKSLEYSIMVPLTPLNKNNLVSMFTASCDPSNYGSFNIYKFPKQETVYGPLQIESRIDQNTEISKDLTLWGQVGSRVIRGNLMVIPIENSILYVEPIYLQATQSKLPELKRVIVAQGDQVVMSKSLQNGIQALNIDQDFEQISQKKATIPQKNKLTKKIIDTYSKAKAALKNTNWTEFGQYFDRLDKLINSLKKGD